MGLIFTIFVSIMACRLKQMPQQILNGLGSPRLQILIFLHFSHLLVKLNEHIQKLILVRSLVRIEF